MSEISKIEISKMLTISTAHIRKSTRQSLYFAAANSIHNDLNDDIIVYKKGEYGWFLYIDNIKDVCDTIDNVPCDLLDCIKLTIDVGADILCLDADGEILSCLAKYD